MDLSSAAPALPSAELAVPVRVPAHGQLLLPLFWPGSHSPSPAGSTECSRTCFHHSQMSKRDGFIWQETQIFFGSSAAVGFGEVGMQGW